jgi:vacuolar-type H+-ATPase subunit E/Vma4
MEEIKGTEGIEQEILEDAKRRVEKVLANAKSETEKIVAMAQNEADKKIEALTKEFEHKLSTYREESLDRLPLERVRLRARFLDTILTDSFSKWVRSLAPEIFGRFCVRRFEANANLVPPTPVKVRYKDIGAPFLDKIVESLRANREVSVEKDLVMPYKGVSIEPLDSSMRLRITSEELSSVILDRYRGELVTALFPRGIEDLLEGDDQ